MTPTGHPLRRRRLLLALMVAISTACEPPRAGWMDMEVHEPRVFAPGTISTDWREYGITFSPDGSEAYFTRRLRRGPSRTFVSRFVDGAFASDRDGRYEDIFVVSTEALGLDAGGP